MIKRIIFDFDNTIVMWKDEYDDALRDTIRKYNLNITSEDFMSVVNEYEYISSRYDKQELINHINSKANLNIDVDFLNYWLEKLGTMSHASEEVKDTLKYLSSKYELVVLTNWFYESQIARMKHAGIDKYFTEIYAGDVNKKPSKEAFIRACGDKKIEECIFVGDNYHFDIEPAISIGMKSILVGSKKDNVESIENIMKLKEML